MLQIMKQVEKTIVFRGETNNYKVLIGGKKIYDQPKAFKSINRTV